MSENRIQKIVKLFDVLIFLLITIVAIFVVGLMTRDSNSGHFHTKDLETRFEDYATQKLLFIKTQQLYLTASIANSVDTLTQVCIHAINEIEAAKIYEIESAREEAQEERPFDIYNSYVDEIIATRYPKLDPETIKAIIYHESRYDPAVSNSRTGVQGLMQIDPRWHTKRALSLGVSDLYDPYGNILVGCDLLNELIESYGYEYALNFYAGGYPYANDYMYSTSPYILEINAIIEDFRNGTIDRELGGE